LQEICPISSRLFGNIMKQIFLYKIFLCAIIFGGLAADDVFAQQTTPTPVKRNSPFAPNPKKKNDPNLTSQNAVPKVNEANNEAKIVNVKAENPLIPQVEEVKTNSAQSENNNSGDFQSRSVAKKTLEIAKRASSVEAAPTEIYKVGIGDILFISLQNAPSKETTYFTILNDGNIDYPLAGEMVQVLGLTTEQIEELLESKIKLYENPQVSVKIREHNSHVYTVLGLVEKSGEKTMPREAIPLFVVKAESVVNSRANQVSLKRGNLDKKLIDLTDAKSGDILIYPGDILEFETNEETANLSKSSQFYFIGGEINSGGRKDYIKGLTLTQAILESGGLKKSNVRKVVVRRKNEAGLLVPTEFDLKAIRDGKAVDPVLEAGDTVEIGNL
jgi:polysaccharide export outer membrane protein